MDNIAIIGPMPEEIEDLKNSMTINSEEIWGNNIIYKGILFGKKTTLIKSGVGKVYAAATAQKLIDSVTPEAIIITGVAGALNAAFEIGDIIAGRDYIQHDYDVTELGFKRGQLAFTDKQIFKANSQLLKIAENFEFNGKKAHSARIISGDQFLTKKEIENFGYLTNELNGEVVEMEAAGVAQVCWINGGIPFICIKTISDKADNNAAVDFNKFMPEVVRNTHNYVKYIFENC